MLSVEPALLGQLIPLIEEALRPVEWSCRRHQRKQRRSHSTSRLSWAMLVIVVKSAPPRLRGRLAVWLLEIRAGVYIRGVWPPDTRDDQGQVCDYIEDGNAVIARSAPNDAGFQFETCGKNCRCE